MQPIRPEALASKALCTVKTARRWMKPELRASMKPATAERVRRAAVKLGWVEPPAQAESGEVS